MNSNHTIKAIFFDLDGTIRHSIPAGGDVFSDYVASLGQHINEEGRLRAARWEHFSWASSVALRDDLLAHSGETENFWIEYSRRRLVALGLSPSRAKLALVRDLGKVLAGSRTEILAASLKSTKEAVDAFVAGARHITVPFDLLMSMSPHLLSMQTVEQFNADGVGIHLKS